MNSLLFNIQYGLARFKSFRKRLILDYKKGDKHSHTNPHAIPLELKQSLLKVSRLLFSRRKAEIGSKLESSNAEVSHLMVDLQNMVKLVLLRVHLPARQIAHLRYTKHLGLRTKTLRLISHT